MKLNLEQKDAMEMTAKMIDKISELRPGDEKIALYTLGNFTHINKKELNKAWAVIMALVSAEDIF